MTLRLDSGTRRRRIAEAVLAIGARAGLDAASIRDVAAEAGVSAGMVQHHFQTRDQMLRFACEFMVERTAQRTRDALQALPDPDSARSRLRTMLHGMLPFDDARPAEVRVWIAFLARAVVAADLEAFMRQTHAASHQFIAGQIRQGQQQGAIRSSIDPDRAAIALFSMAEGLVSHVLIGHYTEEQAIRAIDDQLDALA